MDSERPDPYTIEDAERDLDAIYEAEITFEPEEHLRLLAFLRSQAEENAELTERLVLAGEHIRAAEVEIERLREALSAELTRKAEWVSSLERDYGVRAQERNEARADAAEWERVARVLADNLQAAAPWESSTAPYRSNAGGWLAWAQAEATKRIAEESAER